MDHLIGNDEIKAYLKQALKQDRLGNCLLFTGREGIGKNLFAKALAEKVLCQTDESLQKFQKGSHPDYHTYSPEGKLGMHSIDAMRRFCEEVYYYPNEADKKVFVINDAHRMLPVSSNALLKTLEEPAENSLIILITSEPERLLPTIISRTQRVYFKPLNDQQMREALHFKVPEEEIMGLIPKAKGSISQALTIWHTSQDKRYETLYTILSGKYRDNYPNFQEALQALFQELEQEKKTKEEALPEDWDASSKQKDFWKRSQEGKASLHGIHQLEQYFKLFALWFRDLEILKLESSSNEMLYHHSEKEKLEKALLIEDLPSLEDVLIHLKTVKEGLIRAIKPETCLEALCLKCKLI